MAGVSKIAASVLSATNDNTLALGSLKLDFSLIKYEAPVEFSGLGAALSSRRRTDAEDGLHHKTARRLAALFEQLIPSTPKLITAYGLRSSEIIQTPGVNPKGSSKHGPFASFVGADGTAMWAAATSGVPALGVYLLACLLARAWDAKEAISIWVELVEHRRRAIQEEFRSNHAVSESSLNSVRQDISRDDLARWDASARAWLLSADQAKVKEQTQLMLVLKNCQLPFSGGASTYTKVIQSWQQSLSSLEDLLCGKPQEISSRSIPLAFSAWHLYPNLIVLGSEVRNVTFHDPLVDQRGVGTIALQPRSPTANQGTVWSLTLSHLRYYGDPVTVQSKPDFSRVTIHELHIIALGGILSTWDIGKREILPALQWFVDVWEFVRSGVSNENNFCSLEWLGYLAAAADKVLLSNTSSKSVEHQLLAYGRRRAGHFLGIWKDQWLPFFGLGKDSILLGLAEELEDERAIAYLRAIAMGNNYNSSDAYITSGVRYHWRRNCALRIGEYMTAVPHTCATRKRDADGNQVIESVHARWIYPEVSEHFRRSVDSDKFIDRVLKERLQYLTARGECGTWIRKGPNVKRPGMEWREGEEEELEDPPRLFKYEYQVSIQTDNTPNRNTCPSLCRADVLCRCFDCDDHTTDQSKPEYLFSFIWRIGEYRLFIKKKSKQASPCALEDSIELRRDMYLQPAISAKRICKSQIKADTVLRYLLCTVNKTGVPSQHFNDDEQMTPRKWYTWYDTFRIDHEVGDEGHTSLHVSSYTDTARINNIRELADKWPVDMTHLQALDAFAIATRVYLQLDGATISLKVIEAPLNEARWFTGPSTYRLTRLNLSRPSTLACIVHFESGTILLESDKLDDTLAIASGNSIFVISAVVSDPFKDLAVNSVKRIIGNIGRTGICMLVAPFEPKIRPLGNQYNLVEHAAYDRKRENNFKGTSLHLSFTNWTLALEVKGVKGRTIDQEAYLVESVISVLDSGKWVADLDILGINFQALTRLRPSQNCPGHHDERTDYDYTSLDSWEELLDGPMSVGVFRAHGNWAARLAAVSILSQKNQAHAVRILGPEAFCLECLGPDLDHGGLRKHESPLPSICID